MKFYQERQHLQWLAHCIRMENNCFQKQTLFITKERGGINRWKRLEKVTGIDTIQLRKLMMNKDNFNRWLNLRYPLGSRD